MRDLSQKELVELLWLLFSRVNIPHGSCWITLSSHRATKFEVKTRLVKNKTWQEAGPLYLAEAPPVIAEMESSLANLVDGHGELRFDSDGTLLLCKRIRAEDGLSERRVSS